MSTALRKLSYKLNPPLHCQIPGCNHEADLPVSAPLRCRYHGGTYQADVKFSPLLLWGMLWSMALWMQQVKDLEVWATPELDEYLMRSGLREFLGRCDWGKLADPERVWLTDRFMNKTHPRIRQFTLLTYLKAMSDLPGTVPIVGSDGNVRKLFRLQVTMRYIEECLGRLEPVYDRSRQVVAIKGPWHPIRPKALPES